MCGKHCACVMPECYFVFTQAQETGKILILLLVLIPAQGSFHGGIRIIVFAPVLTLLASLVKTRQSMTIRFAGGNDEQYNRSCESFTMSVLVSPGLVGKRKPHYFSNILINNLAIL